MFTDFFFFFEREKHQCETETSIGCLAYAPRLGIETRSFRCMERCSNQLSPPSRAPLPTLKMNWGVCHSVTNFPNEENNAIARAEWLGMCALCLSSF